MGSSRPYSLEGIPEGTTSENDEQEVQTSAECTERQHPVCPPFSAENTDHGCHVQRQPDRAVDDTSHRCPGPFSPKGTREKQG